MLNSKGAPSFLSQFREFLVDEFKDEVEIAKGKNHDLNDDIVLQFILTACWDC